MVLLCGQRSLAERTLMPSAPPVSASKAWRICLGWVGAATATSTHGRSHDGRTPETADDRSIGPVRHVRRVDRPTRR
jgi:hypothetical protein